MQLSPQLLETIDVPWFAYHLCSTPANPLVLHPTQNEFISHPAKEKVGVCGRRWGKTMAQAVESILWTLKNPGTETFIVAPTLNQATIIMGMIESMLLVGPLQVFVLDMKRSPFPLITFRNGSRIHARSVGNDGKFLRGHHADRLVMDECSFIPTNVMQEVLPPMMAASKFQYQVKISTPFGRNHFWESYIRGLQEDERICKSFRFPSWTNPYLSREYLENEFRIRSRMAWDVEYGAHFHDDQNVLFQWTYIEPCIDQSLVHPADPVPGHQYVIGFDPARVSDRSAVCVMDMTTDPWQVVYLQDLTKRSFGLQEEALSHISERYYNAPILLDATKHDQLAERLGQDLGLTAYPWVFNNQNKWDVMAGVQVALEHKEVTFPNHADFINELRFYQMLVSQSGLAKLGAPEGVTFFDDYVTAFGLAITLARWQQTQNAEVKVTFAKYG